DAAGTVRAAIKDGHAADAERVIAQAARVVSLDHDGTGYAALGERDPVIGRLQRTSGYLRPVLFHSPYEAACWAVISARLRRGHLPARRRSDRRPHARRAAGRREGGRALRRARGGRGRRRVRRAGGPLAPIPDVGRRAAAGRGMRIREAILAATAGSALRA